jgi:protein-disulfide isomerase
LTWPVALLNINMAIQLTPPAGQADHIQGTAHATIEILEYGDFQCPDCADSYWVIKDIQQEYGQQIKFVYRNFPLTEIHNNAMLAALAAEASSLQGKYWQMFDLIYENQEDLSENLLYRLAAEIGLDEQKFTQDLQNKDVQQKIASDVESALACRVHGTPTFFVNGSMFDGGAEDLLQVLSESTGRR